jgi:hypothetical protein
VAAENTVERDKKERELSTRRWVDRGVCVVLFSCAKIVAAENTVERDKKERELLAKRKKKEGGWFFINFSPDFLHTQDMESISIYSG